MAELNITQQMLEDTHELLLKVEVPSERVEPELRKLAKKLGKRVRIPGFRPGKAPANIIIARLGRDYLMQELAEDMVQDVFAEAIQTLDEDAIEPGAYLRNIELEPLTYEFVVPLKPQVDPGDYRSIRVPEEPIDEAEVLKLIDEEFQHLREQNKIWKPVDRPVQYGDLVTMSIKMTVDGETEIDQDEWEFIPDEEDPTLSPEFDAAIVGMKPGESKTFTITFPEDGDSPWSGKTAEFQVEIKSVKAEELPELTDELVAENTEFETIDAFREAIEANIRSVMESERQNKFDKALFEKLREGATIRFAPATLAREVESLEKEREDIYKAYGFESTQQLLDLQGKTREEYRKELEPDAQRRLEERLLLDAIAEKEAFPVSDYELTQLIQEAGLPEEQTQELIQAMQKDEGYRAYLSELIRRRKAYELLKAIARGEEVPEPGQHVAQEAPEEPETEEDTEVEEPPTADETPEASPASEEETPDDTQEDLD